jgi:hypothetical protein
MSAAHPEAEQMGVADLFGKSHARIRRGLPSAMEGPPNSEIKLGWQRRADGGLGSYVARMPPRD